MKRTIFLMLMIVFSLPTLAQQNSDLFEQLTEKYSDKDGFSASQISSEMFDLYLKKKNIDKESPVFDALKKLDNILVISHSNITGVQYRSGYYSSGTTPTTETNENKKDEAKEIHKEILSHYKSKGFALLKTEKRLGEDVKVYLKKNQDKIASLALITNSSVSTNLVELQGDIDLKTVSELNQALSLRGLENLYKIDNSSSERGRFISGSELFSEYEMVARRQREAAERQAELTEEQVAKIELQAQMQAQKQMEMAEKYRQMAEQYGRQPIFLNNPGDTNTVYFLDGKKVKADKIKKLDKETIESVEVKTGKKEDEKTTIRITTK